MHRFIIFSPAYNCERFIESHIHSVENQTYTNYLHILIDDASTDQTYKLITSTNPKQSLIFQNQTNKKWIANALEFLPKIAYDDDIIVCLDADDTFATNEVLSIVAKAYNNNIWLTYGNFKPGHTCQPASGIIALRTFRQSKWIFSHLKTFKYFLFLQIKLEDLLDSNKQPIRYCYDQAIMLPMLEMCQPNRIKFIPDILVIYNTINPLSVEKTHLAQQSNMYRLIRARKQYEVINRK
jgi:glycosyltransferase involved in cell wall biosynthesis